MKKMAFFPLLIGMFGSVGAQQVTLTGDWLLTHIKVNGAKRDVYQNVTFGNDGRFVIMGYELATWKFQKGNSKRIILKSDVEKKFNGPIDIVSLDSSSLITRKDKMEYYYIRIQSDEVFRKNKQSGLSGVWQGETPEGENVYLRFDLPNRFFFLSLFEGGNSVSSGYWISDTQNRSLIIIAQTHCCDKKSVFRLEPDTMLTLTHGKNVQVFYRVDTSKALFNPLNFTREQVEETGDGSLPPRWVDLTETIASLENVKRLNYRKADLLHSVGVFKYSDVSVVFSIENESTVSSTFYEYQNRDTILLMQEERKVYSGSPFFPLTEPYAYRVVGHEAITVPAGTFNCTVVEAVGDFNDERVKLWMIDSRPGIYAKMISVQKPLSRERYMVMELVEIKSE